MYTYIYTHMHNTCVLTSMNAHTLYRCMCICTCTCTDPCTHTKIHTSTHTHVHRHTYPIHMHVHRHVYGTHIHNTFTHVCTHTRRSGQAGPPRGTVSTQSEYRRTQHSFSGHCSLHKDKLPAKFGLSFVICMQLPSECCWKDSWT